MATVFLGIGTNLGDKEENITQAVDHIADSIGHMVMVSSYFYSKPWGFESDNDFVNVVVMVESDFSPTSILHITQRIEEEMGREKKSVSDSYSDRIIDIDILYYDSLILNTPELKIPHPLLQERDFALFPLAEIAPDFIHPGLHKSSAELLESYKNQ